MDTDSTLQGRRLAKWGAKPRPRQAAECRASDTCGGEHLGHGARFPLKPVVHLLPQEVRLLAQHVKFTVESTRQRS
jgi:hypothetical protein